MWMGCECKPGWDQATNCTLPLQVCKPDSCETDCIPKNFKQGEVDSEPLPEDVVRIMDGDFLPNQTPLMDMYECSPCVRADGLEDFSTDAPGQKCKGVYNLSNPRCSSHYHCGRSCGKHSHIIQSWSYHVKPQVTDTCI